ncbi:MAG: glycosyltransferase [Desulfobulbaceae bacterium]|nr:glycosyltransferase [Desulfobulbaceae bacterium]
MGGAGSRKTYRIVVVVAEGIAAPGVMLDYAAAFEELGHHVFILDYRLVQAMPTEEEQIAVFEKIQEELQHFEPDFAVGYNNNIFITLPPRHDPERHFFEKLQIDYVSLFYDNPLLIAPSILTLHSPHYMAFVWDRGYLASFRRLLKKDAFYLPLATNPHVFRPIDSVDHYRADASFIGSLSTVQNYNKFRHETGWHPWLIQFARDVVETWQRNHSMSVDEVIILLRQGFPEDTKIALDAFMNGKDFRTFQMSVYDEIGALNRMEVVNSVPDDLRLHIYGGQGWERLQKENLHLMGMVDYHEEAPLVYNSTLINLNITSAQLVCAVNQRLFDVSACGSFLLTDYRQAMTELFDVDREIVCYRSSDELKKLTDYFLSHPDERQEIADRARARVLAEHTYCHRVQRILDLFEFRASY